MLVPTPINSMLECYQLTPAKSPSHTVGYGVFHGPVRLDDVPAYLPKGAIVAIRPGPDASRAEVADLIEVVATRVINAPLALWLDLLGRRRAVSVAVMAHALGVEATVWSAQPTADDLRAALMDPLGGSERITSWVSLRHGTLPTDARVLLELLAAHAPTHRTVAAIAAVHGPPEKQWGRVFKNAGLGSLSGWYKVLRMVGIAAELQRHPGATLAVVADRHGYSGATALSDRFNDVIGARPTFIRRHLGWQWMLTDGLRRANIMRNGQIAPVRD